MHPTIRPRSSFALLVLFSVVPVLQAQGASTVGSGVIYTCTDDKGRRITSDRPIADCVAKEQRVLNKDGSLRAIYPPSLTADERAKTWSARFVIALLLIVAGIGWLVWYYTSVRPDPSVLPPETGRHVGDGATDAFDSVWGCHATRLGRAAFPARPRSCV